MRKQAATSSHPKRRRQSRGLVNGALLLSFATLIAKVLSAFYRIPLQNLVGNTGFYVYQQVYPLYGIAMTFALSGLPVFISKLIAEIDEAAVRRQVAKRVLIILAVFSGCLFGLLFFGAPVIAVAMGDRGLIPLIQVVSGMALFMPGLAVGRGYAQGLFDMRPTAISQVVEQVLRVAIIILVAWLAASQHWIVYRMGAWAMSGALFGAVAALIIFVPFYQQLFGQQDQVVLSKDYDWLVLARRLLREGGTICLFAAVVLLLQLVDSFTVKRGLVGAGMTQAGAKSLKGVYDRAQPLIQLGLVVATSFSATLLPTLSAALNGRREKAVQTTLTTLIHVSVALSVTATAGLIVLMPMINLVLFGSMTGSMALAIYCLSIVFASLISTYNSILQSMNQYRLSLMALLAGVLAKALFNYQAVVSFGINGASWMTVISLFVMLVVIWLGSPAEMREALTGGRFVRKLGLATLVMAIITGFIANQLQLSLGPGRISAIWVTLVGVIVGVITFVGMALWTRLFSTREWLTLPGGKRLLKIIVQFENN
ncbi:putative polysaccharide biosynthesis protein [Furfurilactobacillus milii]|uniref:Oligosaccharide flippase family protein n=1 Tax=Furfurilactobacillus rossiae TaxID=231049 RepID=A0A7C9IUZ9_9LACO|nr:polysaccharide biosynthesis protein [Furfurilactobacillus milii]MYV06200.1 oligosaccharide flippase family protein [Furfurilactobacillus milii]